MSSILTKKEKQLLEILTNDKTINELVNKIIPESMRFTDFEKNIFLISQKYKSVKKELEELEELLILTEIFNKNGDVYEEFIRDYNRARFTRQINRLSK